MAVAAAQAGSPIELDPLTKWMEEQITYLNGLPEFRATIDQHIGVSMIFWLEDLTTVDKTGRVDKFHVGLITTPKGLMLVSDASTLKPNVQAGTTFAALVKIYEGTMTVPEFVFSRLWWCEGANLWAHLSIFFHYFRYLLGAFQQQGWVK